MDVTTTTLLQKAIRIISSSKIHKDKIMSEIKKEIQKTIIEIEKAQYTFENFNDPDIVDYAIYKEKAELARLSYLFRLAKDIDNIINF